MKNQANILTDTHGRDHTYLRISLVERCNLRCFYCMPAKGVQLTPKSDLMTYEEIYDIAKIFVSKGVNKIRLTGGEPFIRKDISLILEKLSTLPVELSVTTNAVIIHKYMDVLKRNGIKNINVSLDTLKRERYKSITLRDHFDIVYKNIDLLINNGFQVKVNTVLIRGINDDEITDFIDLTKHLPVAFRFIEYMPFDGNNWDLSKMISYEEIMFRIKENYQEACIQRLQDTPHDTAKNYKIKDYRGSFAVISSVTNPFCDTCNRLRLTANGQLKNCLFSSAESDLLTALRSGVDIEPIIQKTVKQKSLIRGGLDNLDKIKEPGLYSRNRSMVTIGG